jgi:uncharacterized protein
MDKRLSCDLVVWLGIEFVLIFFGLIGVYLVVDVPAGPIPVLIVAATVALVHLWRQPGFDRRDLLRPAGVRRELPSMLIGVAAAAVLMVIGVAIWDMDRLFVLLWLVIIVFYPLLSVYPQEVLYRAFLLHRYAPLFGTGRGAAAAGAVAFGFAHLIFGNWISVVLTLGGGWLFARRFQRSRSLLAASVEHALYGVLIFTVGMGELFYHGAG